MRSKQNTFVIKGEKSWFSSNSVEVFLTQFDNKKKLKGFAKLLSLEIALYYLKENFDKILLKSWF